MVSKRWQKHKLAVFNVGLAAITLVTVLILESDRVLWQRGLVLLVSYLVLGVVIHKLNAHYANSFVKVFVAEQDAVIIGVRETLSRQKMSFTTRFEPERVCFLIDRQRLSLLVEAFPLNLPVDSHLVPVPATKVTLTPAGGIDYEMVRQLRLELDRRFS